MPEKPVRRKKKIEEGGEGVQRREEAKTQGPVGRKEGSLKTEAGKPGKPSGNRPGQEGGDRSTLGDLMQLGNMLNGGSGNNNQGGGLGGLGNLLGGSGSGNSGSGGGLGNLLGGSGSGNSGSGGGLGNLLGGSGSGNSSSGSGLGGLGSLLGGGSGNNGSGQNTGGLGNLPGGGMSGNGNTGNGGLFGSGQTTGSANQQIPGNTFQGGGGSGTGGTYGGGSGNGGRRRGGCGRILLFLIVIIILLFLLRSCMGGSASQGGSADLASNGTTGTTNTANTSNTAGTNDTSNNTSNTVSNNTSNNTSNTAGTANTSGTAAANSLSGYGSLSSLFGNVVSDGSWNGGSSNVGVLDSSTVSGARAKRTQILGNGQDQVTILVYMCGTDLESRSGMASRDLQEMLNARLSDKVNILIYTGGCSRWQNNVISSKTNQVYAITSQGLSCLVSDAGAKSMVDPATLTEFIRYGAQVAPANRFELILWDHGGGSESGYGYDEKYSRSGAMSLAGINQALNNAGVTFDFIGFDACLMATVETALVAEQHADYMIGSEETEPGIGWYYTDWLTNLSANTSLPTLEIGRQIADSFSTACATTCYGQDTTLSVIDLAELVYTVPSKLTAFARSTTDMIQNSQFQTVSNARSSTREFAASTRIDQVDLVHLAKNMGTAEGRELADALLGAVKYNTTSKGMTNAYGLSVYFPYSRVSKVDSMVNTYKTIGMDSEYTKCIQSFASMGTAGQIASGGTNYGYGSLFEQLLGGSFSMPSGSSSPYSGYSGTSSGSGSAGADLIAELLSSYLSGGRSIVNGLSGENTEFLETLDIDSAAAYIAENLFDPADLVWQENENGDRVIAMSDEQWSKLQKLQLNFFYDDGEGILDLGCDDLYDEDDSGNLLEPQDRTWVSIDGQPVAYYGISASGGEDDYTIIGRVPAELNGDAVNLIVVFDSENEDGYVAGAVYDYEDEGIDVIAKNLFDGDAAQTDDGYVMEDGTALEWADAASGGYEIRFLCDSYDPEGNYEGSYYIGNPVSVDSFGDLRISNMDVGEGTVYAAYVVTDLYGEQYWTPFLEM